MYNQSRNNYDSTTNGISTWMTSLTATTTVSVVGVIIGIRWYYHYKRQQQQQKDISQQQQQLIQQLQQQRKEERTGRIRAEIRLRTTLKQHQQLQLQILQLQQQHSIITTSDMNNNNDRFVALSEKYDNEAEMNDGSGGDGVRNLNGGSKRTNDTRRTTTTTTMILNSIGIAITPYTKRMGTPRQGALVPSSRGYIQFHSHIPSDVALGLDLYSHVWILFEFHANTDINGTSSGSTISSSGGKTTIDKTKKSKIRPPRGNGIKVGQLATRSPHRPNPIGLSLVTVERWCPNNKRLYISGLDIVDHTPVYDIKPVVPWDIPGYNHLTSNHTTGNNSGILRVPDWVSNTDDIIEHVTYTTLAMEQLKQCMMNDLLAPLYTINNDDGTENENNDDMIAATTTIQQILAQDPRSSHKGLKSNARGTKDASPMMTSTTNNNNDSTINNNNSVNNKKHMTSQVPTAASCYSLIFCQVKISFTVTESDGCRIIEIIPMEFDSNQFVDGVPLLSEGVVDDVEEDVRTE